MITKNDCLLLLSELQDKGLETKPYVMKVLKDNNVNLEVLKFINDNRKLELTEFYNFLRNRYNEKKSKLYKEIVQIDEKQPKDIVVTLSSLLTQILLYSNKVENKQLFLRHSRADEISKVLVKYFQDYDVQLCVSMMNLLKADLKACEYISKNRENEGYY